MPNPKIIYRNNKILKKQVKYNNFFNLSSLNILINLFLDEHLT